MSSQLHHCVSSLSVSSSLFLYSVVAPRGPVGLQPPGTLLTTTGPPIDNCVIRLSTVKMLEMLCVESSSMNFLLCMCRILYPFRQNASASVDPQLCSAPEPCWGTPISWTSWPPCENLWSLLGPQLWQPGAATVCSVVFILHKYSQLFTVKYRRQKTIPGPDQARLS